VIVGPAVAEAVANEQVRLLAVPVYGIMAAALGREEMTAVLTPFVMKSVAPAEMVDDIPE